MAPARVEERNDNVKHNFVHSLTIVRPAVAAAGHKALTKAIVDIGEQIRAAKAAKASKEALGPLIASLVAAKAAYKEATSEDYGPPPQASRGRI